MTEQKEKRFLATRAEAHAFATKKRGTLRRTISPQPVPIKNGWWMWGYAIGAPKATSPRSSTWHAATWQRTCGSAPIDAFCPFGQPGARWWVAETIGFLRATNETFYVASLDGSDRYEDGDGFTFGYHDLVKTPPQQCSRSDARSVVEVTSVRVEQRDGTWEWVVGWKKVTP